MSVPEIDQQRTNKNIHIYIYIYIYVYTYNIYIYMIYIILYKFEFYLKHYLKNLAIYLKQLLLCINLEL